MRVELVYMQSDSQDLFWCSVLIILEMAGLDFFPYVLRDSKPGFVLNLFLIFLPKPRLLFLQNCSYKKECSIGIQPSLTRVTWVSCSDSIKLLDNCWQSKWCFIFQELYFLLGICISRPPTLAPNLCLPTLAHNLYLTALVPNMCLTAMTPNLCLAALGPNLYLLALASNLLFSSSDQDFTTTSTATCTITTTTITKSRASRDIFWGEL